MGSDIGLFSPDDGTVIKMGLSGIGWIGRPAWSFDWQHIAFEARRANGYGNIYVVDVGCVDLPEGCRVHVRNLTEGEPGLYDSPAWSPDGQRIAYTFRATPGETYQIWVMNADGSNKTCLTTIGGVDPDWSPDGSMIAFDSNLGNVAIMQADGSNLRLLSDALVPSFEPAWSPDGTMLALVSTAGRNPREAESYQIYTINVDGTGIRQITTEELPGGSPSWSPDGTRIVFQHYYGGLCVLNVDGSEPMRLDNSRGWVGPAWQP